MFCGQIKRTITQSSACRPRALLPASGLGLGKHAAQRFCLPVESVSKVPSAAGKGILQVVDYGREIVGWSVVIAVSG